MAYAYNAQGIRTAKRVNHLRTAFLLDGGNVIAEVQSNTVTDSYLRGVNLVRRESNSETEYYLFNAHGDVVTTTNPNGTVNQSYDYDAFGNEKDPDALDTNPFRYCGEYLDFETGDYYLRARYYDPTIGRFTQEDTHWNTTNMIYGDELGLSSYTYIPQITAIMQSGNLYVYAMSSPVAWCDNTGEIGLLAQMGIGAIVNVVTTIIAATVTGQKVCALDIAVAAASGALSSAVRPISKICGGFIAGVYTAYTTYQSGASLVASIASGVVSGFVTVGSCGNTATALTKVKVNVPTSVFADTVFGISGNATAAVAVKSAVALSGQEKVSQTGNPSAQKVVNNNTSANKTPTAPSKSYGGGGNRRVASTVSMFM